MVLWPSNFFQPLRGGIVRVKAGVASTDLETSDDEEGGTVPLPPLLLLPLSATAWRHIVGYAFAEPSVNFRSRAHARAPTTTSVIKFRARAHARAPTTISLL